MNDLQRHARAAVHRLGRGADIQPSAVCCCFLTQTLYIHCLFFACFFFFNVSVIMYCYIGASVDGRLPFWCACLANRTLALHMPGGRQIFVTTGGALWTNQRSSGGRYKRRSHASIQGGSVPVLHNFRDSFPFMHTPFEAVLYQILHGNTYGHGACFYMVNHTPQGDGVSAVPGFGVPFFPFNGVADILETSPSPYVLSCRIWSFCFKR